MRKNALEAGSKGSQQILLFKDSETSTPGKKNRPFLFFYYLFFHFIFYFLHSLQDKTTQTVACRPRLLSTKATALSKRTF